MTRYGGVTADAKGEVVTGLVLLRKGANSLKAVEGSKKAMEELKPLLPADVSLEIFYDRTQLITKAVWTVEKALAEAVVLVLLVLIVMLGDVRSALTVAIILPLSVLFTFLMMKLFGVSANLMSLGGLAISVGLTLAARLDGKKHRIFTLLGDGENQEGSVWEAAMSAGQYKLGPQDSAPVS